MSLSISLYTHRVSINVTMFEDVYINNFMVVSNEKVKFYNYIYF